VAAEHTIVAPQAALPGTGGAVFELVLTLAERPCPIGYEEEFNSWLADLWCPYLQSVELTPVGNLVGRVGGSGPRLLLLAHSDEIVFVVRAVEEQGFLRLASNQDSEGGRPSLRGPEFLPLGHPALVLGSCDPVECVFATVTGHLLPPEQPGQTPLGWRDVWVDIGPASRAEVESLGIAIEHAAESAGIPFQRAVYERLGTELIRNGVATAAIAIPTRYTHSPFELVDEIDLLVCVRLRRAVVAGGFSAGRGRAWQCSVVNPRRGKGGVADPHKTGVRGARSGWVAPTGPHLAG